MKSSCLPLGRVLVVVRCFLATSMVLLWGCESAGDCLPRSLTHMVAAFYEQVGEERMAFAPAYDSVVVVGDKGLRRRFIFETDALRLSLPLDVTADSTNYVFYKEKRQWRMSLRHHVELFRPSEPCGVRMRIYLQRLRAEDFTAAELLAFDLSSGHEVHLELTP